MLRFLPLVAAKDYLRELIGGMVPGEELVFTSEGEPIAAATKPPRTSWPCEPGSVKDMDHWMAPDFDTPPF